MKRITRNVDPGAVHDLLERPPRAYLAFDDGGAPQGMPVAFLLSGGGFWIGVSRGSVALQPPRPVTLLIDDGCYWFDLRAVKIRGLAEPGGARPEEAAPTLDWFRLVPQKIVAWDYGTLREEEIDGAR